MFGLFQSATFSDPQLGELRRSRGLWRGTITLDGRQVPLAVAGSRTAPDADALQLARAVNGDFASWRSAIAGALFEHYSPYAESVTAGEEEPPSGGMPSLTGPDGVWPHTTPEFVAVTRLDGTMTLEIGYRVAWDEEHTLGARIQNDRFAGLNGSVLAP